MQCRECGATIADNVSFCPTCGARQTIAAPQSRPASATPSAPVRHAAPPAPPSVPKPSAPAPTGPGKPAARPAVPAAAAGNALAAPDKTALPRVGESFAGRYRVEKYLGLGALCNTYLCRDQTNGNQEVVLKIMHARKAAEAGLADSFLFLAASVAKYDHKGIARIYDTGRHEGLPYYTMEWVGGVPLRLWLMERLSFENRVLPGLGIIVSLLDTFETIHERGCYGCVKPENVFITLNGPVIMDFGVVGFLSPQEFEYNSYARRYLPYMAPELRQDWSNLLPNSDFYSIGALLYEVLVGRVPAPQLRLPSELSSVFGIEADEVILKAMAARPLDRFATTEAFKHAVISLQASLLNARPQDAAALEVPAAARPQAHPSLDVTSDPISIHNPDEAFEDPGTGMLRTPGTGTLPAGGGEPWIREGAARKGEEREAEGVRTVFFAKSPEGPVPAEADAPIETDVPEAPEPAPAEDGKILSAFAQLGDRKLEEAHSQRRFAHGPGPLAGKVPALDAAAEDAVALQDMFPGEDAPPTPAWLWVLIVLTGTVMVALAGYFGLMRGH